MSPLVLLAVLTAAAGGAAGHCLSPAAHNRPTDHEGRRKLARSQMDFSLELLRSILGERPRSRELDNVFVSPLSVYNAVLLSFFTASGHTEAAVRRVLKLPPEQSKMEMLFSYRFQQHLGATDENGKFKEGVNSANRLYVSLDQTVRDCMEALFHGDIEKVDFSGAQLLRTVDRINEWVANRTAGQIRDLLSADLVNPNTQIILTNVAYFKGTWKDQFDERDTRNAKFYVNKNKTVNVPMMFQLNTFKNYYSEELKTEVLQLPYKNNNISLIIFLPDADQTVESVVGSLTSARVESIIGQLAGSAGDKLEVRMPKFTVERTLELVPILEKMGIGDLFKATSDLTGLTGGPKVMFTGAIHKAKLSVDEIGTEAAAATAFTDTRMPSEGFNANRPFVHALYDDSTQTLLFAGVLADPSSGVQ